MPDRSHTWIVIVTAAAMVLGLTFWTLLPPAQRIARPSDVGMGGQGAGETDTGTVTSSPDASEPARRPTCRPTRRARVRPAETTPAPRGLRHPARLPYEAHPAKQIVYERHLNEFEFLASYMDKTGQATNANLRNLEEIVAMLELAQSNRYHEFEPKSGRRAFLKSTQDVKYFTTEMSGMWLTFAVKKSEYPMAFLPEDHRERRVRELVAERRKRVRAATGRK